MKDLNFKNFNYALIDSVKSGYREVLVTYSVDGKTARQCIFIKEVSGKDKNYYLNEAKRQIDGKMANGTLAKNAKKQLKRVSSKGILKPVLISLGIVLGVAGAGVGGYYTYKAINGEGTGQGGGGGGSYQPGDPAPVNFDEESLPKGIKLDIANATVGSDYSTDINLREVAASNGVEYSMPKKLDKVTYKKDTLDVEISDYTYTWVSKTTAKLEIKKDYVLGPISIKLTLQQAEVEDVTLTLAQATTNCKITYNGTPFDATHPITVRNGKNIDLICETLDSNYSITNDSFEFTPALPSETGWTWESNAHKLHIYNLVVGEGKSYALTVSPVKDPIQVMVSHYDNTDGGLHLFYGGDEIPNDSSTCTPIMLNDENKCVFRVELDEGYIITDEDFEISYNNGTVTVDTYTYAGGLLTIEDVPFAEIENLYVDTSVSYTSNYCTALLYPEHCKVIYNGTEYSSATTITVYPTMNDFVQFDIVTEDGYVMSHYDGMFTDYGYDYIYLEEFYASSDDNNHYTFVIGDVDTSIVPLFSAVFSAVKLPDTYIMIDKDELYYNDTEEIYGKGTFVDNNDRSVPFYDLTDSIGYSYVEDIMFYAMNESIQYSIASVDGLMPSSTDYIPNRPSYISLYFSDEIEEGDHITIKLIAPTNDPVLTLDSESSDCINFTDSTGSGDYDQANITPDGEGYCNFYFKFSSGDVSDIDRWYFCINGFPYEIDINFIKKSNCYSGSFCVGTDWTRCNLELHINAPVEISLGEINDDKCDLCDPSTGNKLYSHDEPIEYAPDRNGDIEFDCYINGKESSYMLTTNSFTVTGDIGGFEYDSYNQYLIVHNVTGNFSISIEPESKYIDILTSTNMPESVARLYVNNPLIHEEQYVSDGSPTKITYNKATLPGLYFGVQLRSKDNVIDTECALICTYNEKGNETTKTIYGCYDGNQGQIYFDFEGEDMINLVSMKIDMTYPEIDENILNAYLTIAKAPAVVEGKSMNGQSLNEGFPYQICLSEFYVYVAYGPESELSVSIDGTGAKELQLEKTYLGDRNGRYNWRIKISNYATNCNATLHLS